MDKIRTPKTIADDAAKLLHESKLTSNFLPAIAKRGLALQVEFMHSVAYQLEAAGIGADTDPPELEEDNADGLAL
jgi:hypothetical protein